MKADFGKILNEALRITFKNKWLWVFGLVVAAFSFGGGGPNFSNFSELSDLKKNKEEPQPYNRYTGPGTVPSSPLNYLKEVPSVLGYATVSFEELFRSIPIYYFVLLASVGLFAILISIGIGLYVNSWATSSLISGIDTNDGTTSSSLSTLSKYGRSNAIEMLKLNVLPSFAVTFAFIVFLIPLLLLFWVFSGKFYAVGVLLALPLLVIYLVAVVLISVSVNLGKIVLVLERLKWRGAFMRGFGVFKKFLWDVVVLGILNCFVGVGVGIVSCVGILLFGGVVALGFLGMVKFPLLSVVVLPISAVTTFVAIFLLTLVRGVQTVFNQATWVLLYKQLLGLEDTNAGK